MYWHGKFYFRFHFGMRTHVHRTTSHLLTTPSPPSNQPLGIRTTNVILLFRHFNHGLFSVFARNAATTIWTGNVKERFVKWQMRKYVYCTDTTAVRSRPRGSPLCWPTFFSYLSVFLYDTFLLILSISWTLFLLLNTCSSYFFFNLLCLWLDRRVCVYLWPPVTKAELLCDNPQGESNETRIAVANQRAHALLK